jgi:hypothetical protein
MASAMTFKLPNLEIKSRPSLEPKGTAMFYAPTVKEVTEDLPKFNWYNYVDFK